MQFTKDLILQWANVETNAERNNSNGDYDEDDDDSAETRNVSSMKRKRYAACRLDFNIRSEGIHSPNIRKYIYADVGKFKDIRKACKVCAKAVATFCEECEVALCLKHKEGEKSCWYKFHHLRDDAAKKKRNVMCLNSIQFFFQ